MLIPCDYYKKLNIGDLILIQKGTAIWSIKLQHAIVLYNDIVVKITNKTTDGGSLFVMPQIKNEKINYIDFCYDKSKKLIDKPIIPDTSVMILYLVNFITVLMKMNM